jgi:hypothetical protein
MKLFLLCSAVLLIVSCSHSTSVNGGGPPVSKSTQDTAIAWTLETGYILKDDTADWQPRLDSQFTTFAFYPFSPNPTTGSGVLQIAVPKASLIQIYIDTTLNITEYLNAGLNSLELDLSNYPKGLRHVSVYSADPKKLLTHGEIRLE